ncbi:hypothetical protein CK203_030500 [Vitis vinifera]|uniref:Chromo domain-containing protein n=1 Tax=Vitis vinifera TaxID=29760 RepID=A0A438JDI4_VITVI|nr:hypothetical protein CK203_030500 [Vitis vinifera]
MVLVELIPQQFKSLRLVHKGLVSRAPTTVVTFYEKKVEHSNADQVIGKRSVSPTIEYLVKWKELLESQANWEPVDALW